MPRSRDRAVSFLVTAITHVEFMRTHHITLGTDSEQLAFNSVQQCFRLIFSRRSSSDSRRRCLAPTLSAGNPYSRQESRTLLHTLPSASQNAAPIRAGNSMLDPELSDIRIPVAQGESIGLHSDARKRIIESIPIFLSLAQVSQFLNAQVQAFSRLTRFPPRSLHKWNEDHPVFPGSGPCFIQIGTPTHHRFSGFPG